MESSERAHKSS